MQKTVLVTGGAGFIGSHVVDELIKKGQDVVILDDLSGGFDDNVNPNAKFVVGSTADHELVNKLFEKHGFETVFHLAAYAAEGLSHFIKRFNYTNNLISSVNLINASVNTGVKNFVFTSSIAVYGNNQVPMTEDMIPHPEDSYGIAKLAVEQELRISHEQFGLNYIIFRPHNVYGERQNIADRYRNVIGIFMNRLMQNQSMTIFGDGFQTRAFSHISDVAPIIAQAPENPYAINQIFNIGADTPVSVKRVAEIVAATLGKDANIEYLPARNEVVHAYASHHKLRNIFGITQELEVEEGIQRMAAWAVELGPRKSKYFDELEVTKNMPLSWLSEFGV